MFKLGTHAIPSVVGAFFLGTRASLDTRRVCVCVCVCVCVSPLLFSMLIASRMF